MDAKSWTVPAELPDLRRVGLVAIDTETRDNALAADRGSGWATREGYLAGLSVAWRADGGLHSRYFPIRHPDTKNFDPQQVYRWLRDHVASELRFLTQNGVYDWGWLRAEAGIRMPAGERLEEIGALATMVDENRFRYSLEALCEWRGLPGKDDSLLRAGIVALGLITNKRKKLKPQSHIWQLPARYVGPYAAADTITTLLLAESLNPVINQEKTGGAYRLEVDLLPMVLEMRLRGIRIDVPAAERARDLLLGKRDAALAEISDKLGTPVSMHELARSAWLAGTFDREGIKYPLTEKGNPSFTGGQKGWMDRHPHWLPRLIREADKYHTAGANFIGKFILDYTVNGRIHAEIHPHRSEENGTKSFRFSYSSPPLQLMPSRDAELTPLIRGLFLPEDGQVWAKPDASQQEFRLAVHYAAVHKVAKTELALQRYLDDPDTDFHALAASMTGLERKDAKNVNFAKIYGAGIRKFAIMIGKPESEAKAIYEQYDSELPFLRTLSQIYKSIATRQGHITLYDGARRHFDKWAPGGTWEKGAGPCEREEAQRRVANPSHPWFRQPLWRADTRNALNALIQGSAARHTKLWMRACWREGIIPLLQMHDALECSVATREQAEMVAQLGVNAIKLKVPMCVDLKFGRNWGDATHSWPELFNGLAPEHSTIVAAMPNEGILMADNDITIPDAHVCAQCHLDPPDGLEQRSAYEGTWLHPHCIDDFIRSKMAEQNVAWTVQPASAPPPEQPVSPPPPEPPTANGQGGNGHAGDGLDDFADYKPASVRRETDSSGHGENPATGPAVGAYVYMNALRCAHMRVVRTAGKQFPTYHWENGRWTPGWPKEVVPYRLPELLAAHPGMMVVICEGEKDVDTAARYGFVATTNPGGAGKWQPELTQYFKGKQRVVLMQDNDDAGRKHTALVARELDGIVPAIGVVQFPELPEHGDLTDFFARGGTKQALQIRIDEALKAGTVRPYISVNLSTVTPEATKWLWPRHLACGALELLAGTPQIGKSQIHCQYVACTTTGRAWPNGADRVGAPHRAIMLTAEDITKSTLVPRLIAAGANLKLIEELKAVRRNARGDYFMLGSDLGILEQMIRDFGDVALVTIDPITAYMGSGKHFDSHRATDVRAQLMPLKEMAERTEVAFSAVTHPPKNASNDALAHFIGSQAFIAATRVGHLCVAEMEEDDSSKTRRETGRSLFTTAKINIEARQPTLIYRIEVVEIGHTDPQTGIPIRAPVIRWEGESSITAKEALAATKPTKGANPVLTFLQDILINGPVRTTIIFERGAAHGFSIDQLKRAKRTLGVEPIKEPGGSFNSSWLWALPEHVPAGAAVEATKGAPEGHEGS